MDAAARSGRRGRRPAVLDPRDRPPFLALLDPATRGEVTALMAYAEDAAGGVMNPRYMRLRPEISVEVAIRYLRRQAIRGIEVIDYAYVLAPDMRLLGVVSFRELFAAPPERLVQRHHAHRSRHRHRRDRPGSGGAPARRGGPAGHPRHRRRGPDEGRRHRGRRRGRGAGGGHRGHPEDRRQRGARRAVPSDRLRSTWCGSADAGWPSCSSARC